MIELGKTDGPAQAAAHYRAALAEIDAYAAMAPVVRAPRPEPVPSSFPWPVVLGGLALVLVLIALVCATLQP